MAEFDINEYLAKKYGAPNPSKIDQILQARTEKVAELQQYRESLARNTQSALAEQAIRDGRSAGDFAKDLGLAAMQGWDGLAKLPAMVYDKATTGNFYGPETTELSAMSDEREKLKSAFIQAKNQQKTEEIKKSGDLAKEYFGDGIGGTAAQVAAEFGTGFYEAATDPATFPDFIAQQLPQLAVMGKVGRGAEIAAQGAAKLAPKLAATKAGEAVVGNAATAGAVGFGAVLQGTDVGSDTKQRLMKQSQEDWNKYPEYKALAAEIGPQAAKEAIASQLASEATLKGGAASILSSMLPGGTAIEKTLVGKQKPSFGVVPKAFVGEAQQEGIEEGTGKYFGNTAVQEINPKQDAFEGVGGAAGQGAFMGGLLGGGITGTGVTLDKIGSIGSEKREQAAAKTKEVQDAVTTGDVSTLVDPKSPNYAPDVAIAALFGNNEQETATPETKQANIEKASQIVEDLKSQKADLQSQLEMTSPQGVQTKIDAVKAQIANTDPANVDQIASQTELLGMLEEELAHVSNNDTTAETKAIKDQLTKVDQLISSSESKLSTFTKQEQAKEIDAEVEVSKITPADPVASQAAADRIITLAMAVPERVTTEMADALVADTANGISDTQRDFLRKFSEARVAENTLKDMGDVSQQIYRGSDKGAKGTKYFGLVNYRSKVSTALSVGNQKEADYQLSQLAAFESSHTGKAEIAAEAQSLFNKDGIKRRVVNDGEGNWSIQKGFFGSEQARKDNGGLNIHGGSANFVANIQTEATAVSKVAEELQAAYNIKFGGNTNVQNVPQTQQGSQATEVQPKTETQAVSTEGVGSVGGGTTAPIQATEPAQVDAVATESRLNEITTELEQIEKDTYLANSYIDEADPDLAGIDTFIKTQEDSIARLSERKAALVKEKDALTQRTSGSSVKTEGAKTAEGQNQSTAKPTTTVQEVVPKSEESTTEAPVVEKTTAEAKDGILQATQQTSPEGTAHDQKKFGDFYTQSAGKDTDGSKRPLVAVKDFMSNWSEKVADFLKYGIKDEQKAVLEAFQKAFTAWSPKILANLKPSGNEKFNYTDPIRFLISEKDGKPYIEENVQAAMVAGIFSYVADQSGRGAINTPKDINSILGRSEDDPVSPEATKKLSLVGSYQPQVIDSIGAHIMDALGFKLRKDAPQDMQSKLRVSLGAHALKLMEDTGIVERTELWNSEMAELRGDEFKDAQDRKGHVFFKLARDADFKLIGTASRIVEVTKGSQGVLQKLFGIESNLEFPSLVPPKEQQKESDTGMGIPELIRKVFKKNQQRAWKVNKDPLKVLGFFSEEEGMQMAGVDEDITNIHQRNQLSHKAKNDGLKREFQNFMQFLGEMIAPSEKVLDQEFYLKQEMWKQQRSGYTSNAVNPNSSKIARWLMVSDSWATTIKLNDQKQVDNFLIRLSEGFGVKPEKADSQVALDTLDALMAKPEMQAAIQATQVMLNDGELSDEQKQLFMEAVAKGKQKLHTVAALIAYAHYQQAIDSKADSFETNLMAEVDGVSNGSVLNSVLYGVSAASDTLNKLLEKGGIYAMSSAYRKYNLWRGTPGHQDIYESNAVDLHKFVRNMPAEKQPAIAAIWEIAGSPINAAQEATKEGRDLLKGPINPLNYGGGFKSILNTMSQNFVEKFYDKIQDIAKKEESFDSFLTAINTLLEAANQPLIPLSDAVPITFERTADYYLAFELTKAQEKALAKAYSDTIGEAVEKVIGKNFAPFLERSKQVNKTVSTAYALYNAVYKVAKEAMIKELGIPLKDGAPIHDLTVEQEQELAQRLAAIRPVMHTAMSKQDGSEGNGILLSKKERKQNNSSTYKSVIGFGSALKNGFKQLTVQGRSVQQEGPSVLAISGTTHALDSSISHATQENRHVLNNHDALGDGVGTLSHTATDLNHNTWKSLLNYSPMMESYNALMRVVNGIVAMDQAGNLTSEMKQELAKVFKSPTALDKQIATLFDSAVRADQVKLEAMSKWAVVDQYAMDGGSYTVTDEDRKEASSKLAALVTTPSQENSVAVFEFTQAVFGKKVATPKPQPKAADVVFKTVTSVIGEVGTPKIPSSKALVGFLSTNPNVTGIDLINWFEQNNLLGPIGSVLMPAIKKTISPNLHIRYVTPNTPVESLLNKPVDNARGWISIKGNKEEIYFLSPDFVNSGLTIEAVFHELLHASLARIIDNPATQEAKALVAELGTILTKAREYAKASNITKYEAALSSVQELVSWGITNQGFQNDILKNFKMKSKTRENALITGMKAFFDSIVGFFGKNNKALNTGLITLVQNVSGLFAQAAQTNYQAKGDTSISLAMAQQIDNYSTLDIHQALNDGSVSPAFQEHLGTLLNSIVEKLHGPFGALAAEASKTAAGTPLEVWVKAKQQGMAPFASEILANMGASEQEAFVIEQVEVSIKTALAQNDATAKMAYRTLYNLYTEMYEKFKNDGSDFFKGDWNQATPSERAAAKAKYDFVFGIKNNPNDRSDYLARFAALGLAHEGFNTLLQVNTTTDTFTKKDDRDMSYKLTRWLEQAMGMLQSKMRTFVVVLKTASNASYKVSHTYPGQRADVKLELLVNHLVDIEAKKKEMLKEKATRFNPLEPIEKGISSLADSARTKIAEFTESEFIQNNKSGMVKGVGSVVNVLARDRAEHFVEAGKQFYERYVTAQGSVAVSVLKELSGHVPKLQAALRLTKKFEGDRKDQITAFAKQAKAAFDKKLTKDESASITSTVMRTGLHNLMDKFSLAELENLFNNEAAQDQAIADLTDQLGSLKSMYLNQIKGLAYFKATEQTRVKALMLNAHTIARMLNTPQAKQITEQQASAAEPIIKQLVSLYALKYSSPTEQKIAKDIFRNENNRGEAVGNGIDFLLRAHKSLEEEALQRQFRGNPVQMIHGYTPEILNPHTQFEVATESRGRNLMDYGYSKGAEVLKDPNDPDGEVKRLYVLKGAGMVPRVSGALLFQSDKAKGTAVQDGWLNPDTDQGINNAQIQASFNQKLSNAVNTDLNWDPRKEKNTYAAPVYNEKGQIVNWRYLMHKDTKDALLERDNRFDKVLGTLAGDTFSKPRIREQNKAVLEALKEVYDADKFLRGSDYVMVGPDSEDPSLREFWSLLPYDTQKDVLAVWGQKGMYVKPDSFDLIFGYRKRSIAEPLIQRQKNIRKLNNGEELTEEEKQGVIAKSYVWAIDWALYTYAKVTLGMNSDDADRYTKRGIVYALRSERAWQEVVQEIKTIYVIKNITTMVTNNISNLSQLLVSGVSLKEIVTHYPTALRAVTDYTTDRDRLTELENQLSTGYTQGKEKEIQHEILRLKDAIARNPARELIEAGLMPTIVEDVAEDDDAYSYKTEFAKKTEKYTNKLNPNIKEVAKFMYMTRDTQMYKGLHRATQLGDFVARYVLFHHLTERAEKPMSKAEAIQRVSEDFVNYDIQMHRNIQFMDDMGLFMFTKYFLRMQRVLLRLGKEKPARVLGMAAADSYFNLSSNVLNSSVLHHAGNNPFTLGAFGFPGALDDIAMVKMIMSLVK